MEFEKIQINYNSISKIGTFTSPKHATFFREKFKILAEPIGTPITSRRQNKILIQPFVLFLYDIVYLYDNKAISIDEGTVQFEEIYETTKKEIKYKIYKDLKEKDLYLISGFKFGCDFLAYKEDPNFIHSDFLICCFEKNDNIDVKNIILNERISITNKKKLIFAFASSEMEDNKVEYANLSWVQI